MRSLVVQAALIAAIVSLISAWQGLAAQESSTSAEEELDQEEDLLERITALELEVMDLKESRGAAGEGVGPWIESGERSAEAAFDSSGWGASSGTMGRLGQTTRFSRTFNPAVGVVIDMIANRQTGSDSGENQDRFWLRTAELNLAAQVDPFGYAYVVIGGNGENGAELVEAAAVLNRLPANFSLKGGRLLADHGKLGQRHDHELPFVEKPGVYYDYLGGSLNSNGFEVHQWFGLTDEIPVRWSLGMYNELEGHGHRLSGGHSHGHDEDEIEPFGHRQPDNFAYNARLTGYGDFTECSSLQVGSSFLWAPEIQEFHQDDPANPVERIETRRNLAGIDVTYQWQDPSSRREFIAGVEGFRSDGEFFHDDEDAIEDATSLGGYAWFEYGFSPYWSTGAMAGMHQLARHEQMGQRELSAWVTWKVTHFNWLRFQYRFNDLERGAGEDFRGEDFSEFILQWTIVFGTHAHGLDW